MLFGHLYTFLGNKKFFKSFAYFLIEFCMFCCCCCCWVVKSSLYILDLCITFITEGKKLPQSPHKLAPTSCSPVLFGQNCVASPRPKQLQARRMGPTWLVLTHLIGWKWVQLPTELPIVWVGNLPVRPKWETGGWGKKGSREKIVSKRGPGA